MRLVFFLFLNPQLKYIQDIHVISRVHHGDGQVSDTSVCTKLLSYALARLCYRVTWIVNWSSN